MNEYKHNILQILETADVPLDVEKIRVQAHIGNWQTALKHLLELTISGEVEGTKTSKSWVFWLKDAKETKE